jgi:hypothetical protein
MWSQASPFADDPPATREPRAADVKIPAAKFICSDQVWAADDPAGDQHAPTAPWLDIRHVALARSPSLCVTVRLAAPPMPGTVFTLGFKTKDGSRSESGQILVIATDGTVYFSGNDKQAVAGVDYGTAGTTTLVLYFSNITEGFAPDRVSVIAQPLSESEPLIRAQPPIFGGDQAGS